MEVSIHRVIKIKTNEHRSTGGVGWLTLMVIDDRNSVHEITLFGKDGKIPEIEAVEKKDD